MVRKTAKIGFKKTSCVNNQLLHQDFLKFLQSYFIVIRVAINDLLKLSCVKLLLKACLFQDSNLNTELTILSFFSNTFRL